VIEETMRLYPPAFLVARAAREKDNAAGVEIGKGDIIMIAPWLLHRHEKLWDQPNAFIPKRFMSKEAPDRFAYLPFGAGPRVCIGAPFAQAESVLALARLIGAFRVELADSIPVIPHGVVTTQPDRSPLFSITRR
jgi:cytochrome P450